MSLTLTLDRAGFDQTMTRLLAGVSDFSPVTGVIAQLLEDSVRRNFIEGGRPEKWPASKRADRDAGYGKESGQTLVDTARLMNSVTGVGDSDQAKVGTNVDSAPAHNFGVDKEITQQVREHVRRITQAFGKQIDPVAVQVKSHNRKHHLRLPKREFMLVQDEDWQDIAEVVTIRINKFFKGD